MISFTADNTERLPGRGTQRFEKVLCWGAALLLEFHMLHCLYRDVAAHYLFYTRAERWLGLVLLAAGLGYLLFTLLTQNQAGKKLKLFFGRFCSFEQGYLVFVFFWYIVVVALRQFFFGQYHKPGYYFHGNDWWIYLTALVAFVIFPMARFLGNRKMERAVPVMLKIVLIPNIVFHTWVLWHYFNLHTVRLPSGTYLRMDPAFAMQIGGNQNMAGAHGMTMLLLCLYLALRQKSWRKFPYVYGMAVYFIVMVYTNCRSGWYSCLLALCVSAFLGTRELLKGKRRAVRNGYAVLAAAGAVLLLHAARAGLFLLLEQILRAKGVLSPLETLAGRTWETGLNGRGPIYRACLYVMFHSRYAFLFGVTPTDLGTTIYNLFGVDEVYPHAHNFFLQMGVCYGVPTMVLTILFAVMLAVRSFRVLFWYEAQLSRGAWMIPVIVWSIMALDMMEAYLNASNTMVLVAFYLFAGWLVALDAECRGNRKEMTRQLKEYVS